MIGFMSSRNPALDLFLPSLPITFDGAAEMVKRKLKKFIVQAHEMWSELKLFFLSVLFLFTFESKFSRMWSRPSLTIITNREQFLADFTISKLLMLANHTKTCHKQIFWGLSALTLSFAIAEWVESPKKRSNSMTTDSRQCVLDSYQHSLDNALCVGSENYLSVGLSLHKNTLPRF